MKVKTQKGITLVALIITIIVLLILAVVAITAIQNDGIFSHADNAATKFNNAQTNEQRDINSYETFLNTYGGGSTVVTPPSGGDDTPTEPVGWVQNGTEITKTGVDPITVGDTVDYTAPASTGYTGSWKVLGAENGQILLLSDVVSTSEGYGVSRGWEDADDFINDIDTLAASYVNAEKYATTGARGIKTEDFVRLLKSGNSLDYSNEGTEFFSSTSDLGYLMLFKDSANTATDIEYFLTSVDGGEPYYEEALKAYMYEVKMVNSGYVVYGSCVFSDVETSKGREALKYRVVVPIQADTTFTSAGANSWTLGSAE